MFQYCIVQTYCLHYMFSFQRMVNRDLNSTVVSLKSRDFNLILIVILSMHNLRNPQEIMF